MKPLQHSSAKFNIQLKNLTKTLLHNFIHRKMKFKKKEQLII